MEHIAQQVLPNYVVVERNNRGMLYISELERRGLKVVPITTVGDTNTHTSIHTMDKNHTISYLRNNMDKIRWPGKPGPGMKELISQIGYISEFKTPGGKSAYRARKGHDDMFMAFLICVHMYRIIQIDL